MMRARNALLTLLLAAGFAGRAAAQQPARPSAAEASLLAAEDARFAAQVRHDVPGVARALADELTYTHASGRIQTRSDYLKAMQAGAIPYRSIETSARTVRVFGHGGMTHGLLHMVVGDRRLESSYLAVYVRRDGRWQLLAWQTSPDPASASK